MSQLVEYVYRDSARIAALIQQLDVDSTRNSRADWNLSLGLTGPALSRAARARPLTEHENIVVLREHLSPYCAQPEVDRNSRFCMESLLACRVTLPSPKADVRDLPPLSAWIAPSDLNQGLGLRVLLEGFPVSASSGHQWSTYSSLRFLLEGLEGEARQSVISPVELTNQRFPDYPPPINVLETSGLEAWDDVESECGGDWLRRLVTQAFEQNALIEDPKRLWLRNMTISGEAVTAEVARIEGAIQCLSFQVAGTWRSLRMP